jgi:hypothetical protein
VNFTDCDTLSKDHDANVYSLTVRFELIVDGINLGPCRSTITLGVANGEVSAPMPEDPGIDVPSIPKDVWIEVVGEYVVGCMRAGRLAMETLSDDELHSLRSVSSRSAFTFEMDPVPPEP